MIFHPLGQTQICSIARIQVQYLVWRLADRDIDFEFIKSKPKKTKAVNG